MLHACIFSRKWDFYFVVDQTVQTATVMVVVAMAAASTMVYELWQPKNLPHSNHFTHLYATSHTHAHTHTHTRARQERFCILQIPRTVERKFWNLIHPPSSKMSCMRAEWMSKRNKWHGDLVVTVHCYAHRMDLFIHSFVRSFFSLFDWVARALCLCLMHML